MSTTPTRPGPAAYATVGAVISAAPIPVVIRIITTVADVRMSAPASLGLTVAALVLFVAAPALLARVIVRYFRAVRAEDRAELTRVQSEVAELQERVSEVEDQAWWNDPGIKTLDEDTVDLSNVRFLPQQQPPEKRSS